jgi:carboxyl-terminal processing protease
LALTTAHYYTPSGRLIQRPWDSSFDEYLSYGLQDQDENQLHDPDDLKRTQGGRPVYSGGGIEPDRHVAGPVEGFNPTSFGRLLYSRGAFENYAVKFMAEGDTRVGQESVGRTRVARDFAVDDAMVADFKEQLRNDGFQIDEETFAQDREFVRAMIGFRIDEVLFNMTEARRRLISVDPQAQIALGLFGEAEKLAALSSGQNQAN